MMTILIYLAGIATPFLIVAVYSVTAHALSRNHGTGCAAYDWGYEIGERTRIGAWFAWRWHLLTVGRKQWHRDAVAAYMAKWGR